MVLPEEKDREWFKYREFIENVPSFHFYFNKCEKFVGELSKD